MLDQHFSRIKAAYFSVFKSSPSDFLQKTSSLDSFVKRQPHLSKFGIQTTEVLVIQSVECIQEENIQFLLSNKAVLLLLLCWLGAKKKKKPNQEQCFSNF